MRDPGVQPELLFSSVIFNDLMHWELNCCDYGFEAILGVMTNDMKVECDNNVRNLPMFRNPDGSAIRRFEQVTNLTYLTTARRLTLMFVWVHALGTEALILPAACRKPALAILANMQVMILASQGRRAYSVRELDRLYVETARDYFGAIEFLMQHKQDHDASANRKIFKPMKRYTRVCIIHSYSYIHTHVPVCRGYGRNHVCSETDSDGDGGVLPKLGGRGHIEFSTKGIPHGSLHFPEQLQ